MSDCSLLPAARRHGGADGATRRRAAQRQPVEPTLFTDAPLGLRASWPGTTKAPLSTVRMEVSRPLPRLRGCDYTAVGRATSAKGCGPTRADAGRSATCR